MIKKWQQWTLLIGLVVMVSTAYSHQTSTAYLTLKSTENSTQGQYQIKLFDLAMLVDLDMDRSQTITWREVKSNLPAINNLMQSKLSFESERLPCQPIDELSLSMDAHFNEPFVVIDFTLICGADWPSQLEYRGVFDFNNGHKLLVNAEQGGFNFNRILDNDNQTMTLDTGRYSPWITFKQYTYQGVIHILIGLDHIMFLLCLLLSIFCLRTAGSQQLTLRSTVWQVVGLVNVFTVAHSLTLVLTALNWLSFPSRWVEIIIALTVALTALNNVWPFINRIKWITFLFGLMHGMGFAGVLGELGLPTDAKLMPILAFNLGVEMGQVALTVMAIPLLIWINRKFSHAQLSFRLASTLILILACYWVIQRF